MPRVPSHRSDSLVARLLPPRHILLRNATGYATYTISTRLQGLVVLGAYLGAALIALGATGYLSDRARLAEQGERLAALQRDASTGYRARDTGEARLRAMVDDLESMGARQRETIASLDELRDTLQHDLDAARDELKDVTGQRDVARTAAIREEAARLASTSGAAPAEQGAAPATDTAAAGDLAQRIEGLATQLAQATDEGDRLRRSESGLRWRVEMLETRLNDMRQNASAETGRVREWIVKQVSALEGVLSTSGVDVDRLIQRVDTGLSSGQGGPLEPLPPAMRRLAGKRAAAALPSYTPTALPMAELARLRAIHTLLQTMPLVPPMAVYKTNSGFGVRRDPITGRQAVHPGLDFGGTYGARALATAPGRVVRAGRAGAYGNMVEVSHGMGIRTRYAHLSRVLVRPGDRVTLRQPVGIMGSTGRSTGMHLHYEVRLDGVAYDPMPFLEAGRHLKDAFKE